MPIFQNELHKAVLYSLSSTLSTYAPASRAVLAREIGRRMRAYLESRGYEIPRGADFRSSVANVVHFFESQGDFEMLSQEILEDGTVHVRTRHPFGVEPFIQLQKEVGVQFGTTPLHLMLLDDLDKFDMELDIREVVYDGDKNTVESWTRFSPRPPRGPEPAGAPLLNLDAEHVISVERERSRALQEQTQHMTELHRLKAAVMAGISHELKTPLHCILGYTGLLTDNPSLEQGRQQEYLDIIAFNGRQLLRLVDDVVDWSALEMGQVVLQYNDVPVRTLLERAVRSLALQAADRGVDLSIEVTPDDLVVQADPARLLQVTVHLALNGIKFSPPGDRVVLVARYEPSVEDGPHDMPVYPDGVLRMDVVDRGVGIAPEDQERIFGSFQQVRTADGKAPSGSGLGLAIARGLVELHGGRVWVRSRPQEGAVFSLALPLHRPPP